MFDSRSAIEEIRTRVGVVDLISEYVTLKRAGKNFTGLCPFHPEKTPSFSVSGDKGYWHCFGCGEHGDVFGFVMKIENLTFREALERLAKRAGVDLEPYQDSHANRRDALIAVNSLATGYYQSLLRDNGPGLEYLRSRGLADQTIEQFMLGYAAPAWDGLTKFLAKRKVDPADAVEAGLISRGERGYYDRFRHRVMFPILDIQQRVIAFGGRALGDDPAKYLNSPETPVFSKTKSLYGLYLARKTIGDQDRAVIVEGYMDVITAHQAGFASCLATLGTALTAEQIRVISRYTKNVVLAYDADSAGMKAALRGASMFDEAECAVRIARLPRGDDPDSLIRGGRAPEFSAAIDGAMGVLDYRLALLQDQFDLTSPTGRAGMLKEATKIVAEAPEAVERERLIRSLARYHPNYESGTTRAEDHLRLDVDALLRRQTVGGSRARYSSRATPKPSAGVVVAERALLKALIDGGEPASMVLEAVTADDFTDDVTRAAAMAIFERFADQRGIYLPELIESADAGVGRFLSELSMKDDGPPVTEKALSGYIAALKKWKVRNKRTSDILAPYIKDGAIEGDGLREKSIRELREFLEKSGRLRGDAEQ